MQTHNRYGACAGSNIPGGSSLASAPLSPLQLWSPHLCRATSGLRPFVAFEIMAPVEVTRGCSRLGGKGVEAGRSVRKWWRWKQGEGVDWDSRRSAVDLVTGTSKALWLQSLAAQQSRCGA